MNEKYKNKKQGTPWAALIILLPILMLRVTNGDLPPAVMVIFILAVIAAVVVADVRKKKAAAASKKPVDRPQPTVQTSRPVPSMQRREPNTAAHRDFPKPEAPCVVCEQTGEDHFARDKHRRIAQLDDWLKNGLIDRQEYLVLKQRFQNDQ